MLHAIDNQGNIQWHCPNPGCAYHNCQGWDRGINCAHHANQQNEDAGQTITAHVSDPGVQWTGPQDIALPPCPGCGSKTTLHVHDDEECTPPIITEDEQTGKILQVAPHPHPKFSGNLWFVDKDIIRKQVPHPTLAHLTPAQIEQKKADMRNGAPDVPVDWMMTEAIEEDIHSVFQHPAVARHRSLAEQLKAAGKVYQPKPEPEQQTPPVFTLDQVKEIVTQQLQEHGVITSPRIPAVSPPPTQ